MFAPKGTPKEITPKLVDALDKALSDDGTRKRLLELGGVIPEGAGRSPQALAEARRERGRALDADPQGRGRDGAIRPVRARTRRLRCGCLRLEKAGAAHYTRARVQP